MDWTFSPSIGNSGGILSMWNTSQFSLREQSVNRYWIAIKGSFPSLNFNCILINIYNPCSISARADVWAEISNYWKTATLPCLIIGDFNDILNASERGSNLSSQCSIDNFKKILQELQLMEFSPSVRGFTWFRGNAKSVLDRLFVNPEWLSIFPSLNITLLQRGLSDHCPLLVQSKTKNWGPKPFRFQNFWLTDPKCLKIVKESWSKSSSRPMVEKLRADKTSLKQWNQKEFGNLDSNIANLESTIQSIDNIANQRNLDSEELEKRKAAQEDLWLWMKRRELYWAQCSRISWLKEGDKNTKFFHAVASNRRRKNEIPFIEINGCRVEDPNQIKQAARNFFSKIFKEENANRPIFDKLEFKCLSSEQAATLTLPFSDEEIDSAVSSCDSNKAPGPDGFNFQFVKSAWHIIKHEIYGIVREFQATAHLPSGCNTAYITLNSKN